MRVLWISLLLIESISCLPPQGVSGSGKPMWSSSEQAPFQSAYEKPAGQASGPVGYSSYPGQASGSMGYSAYPELYYGGANTASESSPFGGQSVPQVSQYGSSGSSGPYQQVESWSSSSDTSGEDEPVFTPVEDDDQVYAFKSRSRYNRKRLLFDQFRYTPTEPLHLEEPLFPPHYQPGERPYQKDQSRKF